MNCRAVVAWFKALSRHLPGGTDGNHEKPLRLVGIEAEVRKRVRSECYQHMAILLFTIKQELKSWRNIKLYLHVSVRIVEVHWVPLLLRTWEVLGWNLGLAEVWCGFPYYPQTNAGVIPQMRAWSLPSTSFSAHCSLITIRNHLMLCSRTSSPLLRFDPAALWNLLEATCY
jgi:hypothetical protein